MLRTYLAVKSIFIKNISGLLLLVYYSKLFCNGSVFFKKFAAPKSLIFFLKLFSIRSFDVFYNILLFIIINQFSSVKRLKIFSLLFSYYENITTSYGSHFKVYLKSISLKKKLLLLSRSFKNKNVSVRSRQIT